MTEPDYKGFAQAIAESHWPGTIDFEASEIFELALEHNIIRAIPGGFDPEKHDDIEGVEPKPGDPWYEYTLERGR